MFSFKIVRVAGIGAFLFGSLSLPAQSATVDLTPSSQTADSRGFIDVWKLRRDVALVEPLQSDPDIDQCSSEGDPEEAPPGEQEIQRRRDAYESCTAEVKRRYAAYQRALEAFNKVWQPAMMAAVRKGDTVAEVILRQCDTTPVLDRSHIESSCDQNPERRAVAAARLHEIGFVPAFDRNMKKKNTERGNRAAISERTERQQEALEAFRHGALGIDRSSVNHGGNAPRTRAELEEIRAAALIDAVLQDAPRAFSFSPYSYSAGWKTSVLATLSLNRQPLTPGYLTWGRELYYGGGNWPWTGPHYWRSGATKVYPQYEGRRDIKIGGREDPVFMQQLQELLAIAERNIDRYLRQDPRWGVFLLHRVGHHEWVPEGMASSNGVLDAEWLGAWVLEKSFSQWQPNQSTPQGSALVYRDGGKTRITFASEAPVASPVENAAGCVLRYSGGLTYLPEKGSHATTSTHTVLGYLPGISGYSQFKPGPVEVFAAMNPKFRYKQVLVQCAEGESSDTNRVRFVLLAGNTLIEVARDDARGSPVVARHFRRASADEAATIRAALTAATR